MCPLMRLPSNWHDVEDGLSRKVRQNLDRGRKALGRIGSVREAVSCDAAMTSADLADFFRHHETRWGLDALLARGYERHRPFITEAFLSALGSGLARYAEVWAGAEWVAGQLLFDYAGRRYLSMISHNTRLGQTEPGNLACALTIRDAIERGLREYDFGAGKEPYKRHFAAHSVQPVQALFSRSPLHGCLLMAAEHGSRRLGR
jgi:CelD/BcsL family acetyltransferase involved in cellulose biosynthesis